MLFIRKQKFVCCFFFGWPKQNPVAPVAWGVPATMEFVWEFGGYRVRLAFFYWWWGWMSYIPAKWVGESQNVMLFAKKWIHFLYKHAFFLGCRRSIIACFAKFARSLLLQVACFTDPAATDIKYGEKHVKGSVPLRMFAFFIGKSSGFDSKDVGLELLKIRLSF